MSEKRRVDNEWMVDACADFARSPIAAPRTQHSRILEHDICYVFFSLTSLLWSRKRKTRDRGCNMHACIEYMRSSICETLFQTTTFHICSPGGKRTERHGMVSRSCCRQTACCSRVASVRCMHHQATLCMLSRVFVVTVLIRALPCCVTFRSLHKNISSTGCDSI